MVTSEVFTAAVDQQLLQQVLQYALSLLARREYSYQELRSRLISKSGDDALVAAVLERLQRQDLQSDRRYTSEFVHSCIRKGKGPNWIRQKLEMHGITAELLADCLAEQAPDWNCLAEQARVSRFGKNAPLHANEAAKQARFLYARGFDEDNIEYVMLRCVK